MTEQRVYCYECISWGVPMKDKPCNICIGTRLVKGKPVDTYERKNYEPRGEKYE